MIRLWKQLLRIPNSLCLGWIGCIILLRIYLETVVLASTPYGSGVVFIYHGCWFACVFLSLGLWLHQRLRLSRTVLLRLFSLGVLAIFLPVLSSVFTGSPADLEFIYGTPLEILFHWATFTFLYPMVNWGFRIELLLVFLVITAIALLIHKNKRQALGTGLIAYAIIGFWLIIPELIGPATFMSAQGAIVENTFSFIVVPSILSGGQFLATLYVLLFALLLHIAAWVANARALKAYLINYRPKRTILFAIFAALAFLYVPVWHVYDLLLAIVIYSFLWMYMVAINDIYDYEIDAVSNTSRPLVSGAYSKKTSHYIAIATGGCALLLASIISSAAVGIALLSIVIGYIYSVPPVRLRDHIYGIAASTASQASAFLIGYIVLSGSPPSEEIGHVFLLLWIAIIGLFQVKDIKDFEGDKKQGVQNLLTVFGYTRGKQIMAIWFVASFLLFGYILLPHISRGLILFFIITLGVAFSFGWYIWRTLVPQEKLLFRGAFGYLVLVLLFL